MGLKAKIIFVEWVDACAQAGWINVNELNLQVCYSCGFLVRETKESITISSSVSHDQVNASICIPKAWIRRKKTISMSRHSL